MSCFSLGVNPSPIRTHICLSKTSQVLASLAIVTGIVALAMLMSIGANAIHIKMYPGLAGFLKSCTPILWNVAKWTGIASCIFTVGALAVRGGLYAHSRKHQMLSDVDYT